jgi:hypothetical protein
MGVMEHFLLLVPGPLPGCIFMRHIILALFTVYDRQAGLHPVLGICDILLRIRIQILFVRDFKAGLEKTRFFFKKTQPSGFFWVFWVFLFFFGFFLPRRGGF